MPECKECFHIYIFFWGLRGKGANITTVRAKKDDFNILTIFPWNIVEMLLAMVLWVAFPSLGRVLIILGEWEPQKENQNNSHPGSFKHLLEKLKEW